MRDGLPPALVKHGLLELDRAPTTVEIQSTWIKALFMLSKSIEDRTLARYTRVRDPHELWTDLRHNCADNTITGPPWCSQVEISLA